MFSDRASKKDQLVLLRLSASHVNALIEAESKRYHELDQNSGIGAVSLLDARSSNRHAGLIYYFISHQGKQYCLFNVTKDSETRENQEDLPYFGELFNVIKAQPEYAKKTILIPMRQCRGFLKFPVDFKPLQREHIVLVELDITAQTIRVHDSQSRLKYIFYPDHLFQH